jgi:hypothetical protein
MTDAEIIETLMERLAIMTEHLAVSEYQALCRSLIRELQSHVA